MSSIKSGLHYIWNEMVKRDDVQAWAPKNGTGSILIQSVPPSPKMENEPLTEEDYEEIINTVAERAIALKKRKSIERAKRDKKEEYIVSVDDPEKYDIVKKFINDKGLKLYGGVAINLYLPKEQRFYDDSDVPDFDFYSPDPWNDAVELADVFYKAGYRFVEVKSGIHPGTYKVFVNLWPVADITWMPKEQFDLLGNEKIDGVNVVNIYKLLEAFYKEFSEPFGNPTRWTKVATREKLIQKWVKPLDKDFKCSSTLFVPKNWKLHLNKTLLSLLDTTFLFFLRKEVVVVGGWAYNKYLEIGGAEKRLFTLTYEGLCEKANEVSSELVSLLLKKHASIRIETIYSPYKELNKTSYSIYTEIKGVVYKLCTLTDLERCVPYKTIDNTIYGGVDYIFYELYDSATFGSTEEEREDAKCLAKYLREVQQSYYRREKVKETDDTPFQRLIPDCIGPYGETVKIAFLKKWREREEEKKKVIRKWDSDYRIRFYPKEEIPKECLNKPKSECKYPCGWNPAINKCTKVPKGVYIPGRVDEDELHRYV